MVLCGHFKRKVVRQDDKGQVGYSNRPGTYVEEGGLQGSRPVQMTEVCSFRSRCPGTTKPRCLVEYATTTVTTRHQRSGPWLILVA
jgi:hypothetical protein